MRTLWLPFEPGFDALDSPLIDTHCHLDDDRFDADRTQVITHAKAVGVVDALICSVHPDRFEKTIAVAHEAQWHYALGIHPYFLPPIEDLNRAMTAMENAVEKALDDSFFAAIGEIGLDGRRKDVPIETQSLWFDRQLHLASQLDLPVSIHANGAVEAVIQSLKKAKMNKGIVHAFNGSLEQAKQLINLGFKLGFGSYLTNPNAKRILSIFKQLPNNAIVLETDAPDMPTKMRLLEMDKRSFVTDIWEYRNSGKELREAT